MRNQEIKFHSTNNKSEDVDFKKAVLTGQASDKGLYMLNEIEQLDDDLIYSFRNLTFQEIALEVLANLISNAISRNQLRKIIEEALNFEIPVKNIIDNDYMCYLDRGPTASFKDIGARSLAKIMEYLLEIEKKEIVILTATSGDTGGAIAQAFYKMSNIKVVVLYPKNEISELQRKQMTTLGKNITAIGINGKFDDCQRYAKKAFADKDLISLNLSSANSINIGRLLPQTLYYFWSYSRIVDKKNEEIIFSVPSGNFGNLTGGLIAYKMGLPVKKFIVAVNENDEFPQFLKRGKYEKVEPSIHCISNAMNVGHPSNLARIIDLYGGQIDEKGNQISIPDLEKMRNLMVSYSISDGITKKTIKEFYQTHHGVIEPHGAVGWAALKIFRDKYLSEEGIKAICFETADPAKFPEEIIKLIEINPKIPKSLITIQSRREIPNPVEIDNYQDFKNYLQKDFFVPRDEFSY